MNVIDYWYSKYTGNGLGSVAVKSFSPGASFPRFYRQSTGGRAGATVPLAAFCMSLVLPFVWRMPSCTVHDKRSYNTVLRWTSCCVNMCRVIVTNLYQKKAQEIYFLHWYTWGRTLGSFVYNISSNADSCWISFCGRLYVFSSVQLKQHLNPPLPMVAPAAYFD